MLYIIEIRDPDSFRVIHEINHPVFAKTAGQAVFAAARGYGFVYGHGNWKLTAREAPIIRIP